MELNYIFVGSGCPGHEYLLVNNECVLPSNCPKCEMGTFTDPTTGNCVTTCPTNYL